MEALNKEIKDYEKVITAPQQAIGGRSALTRQARARFNAVEAKFENVGNLILQFGNTAAGRALIAAFQASRIVRDVGRHSQPVAQPIPPTSTSPT